MARFEIFALLFVALFCCVIVACPWDTATPNDDDEEATRRCYRCGLNQSCFVECDRNAPNLFQCANPSSLNHVYYMQYTINITKAAHRFFGAIIVDKRDGSIAATGINTGTGHFTIGHGEINVIINFTTIFPTVQKPFNNYVLYTTGEPCPMCMSAIIYSGFSEVVWATGIPELIVLGWPQINIRAAEVVNTQTRPGPKPCLVGGLLADQMRDTFAHPPFTPIPPNSFSGGNGHDGSCGGGHDH